MSSAKRQIPEERRGDVVTKKYRRAGPMNETDTCQVYVTPALRQADWDRDPHRINEQVTFTDGHIVVVGQKALLRWQPL
jgi:hypothetical protein